jgi:hypothetical protein
LIEKELLEANTKAVLKPGKGSKAASHHPRAPEHQQRPQSVNDSANSLRGSFLAVRAELHCA